MRTADFQFDLPSELIAQHPAAKRDQSRLLVLHRKSQQIEHRRFPDLLDFLHAGDVLVLNNSRVIPARLHGVNVKTGGKFEMLLLEENAPNDWWAMMKPGKSARVKTQIALCQTNGGVSQIVATVLDTNAEGHRRLHFSGTPDIRSNLDQFGEVPLPPYIERPGQLAEDKERYQTVFAKADGSVAAPTAGLHFTAEILEQIRAIGVKICFVTLHVGVGTFTPVKAENLLEHRMHEERFEIDKETAKTINDAKSSGNRVIAVGTTSVRVLESAARQNVEKVNVYAGKTNIFIFPPFQFRIVDALLTNFHLPCSTLLMLVSAFASSGGIRGRELILSAYTEAIRERYRFFSYGDAMLIL
ncbi:MAG TPA: tRNA preQ1(34) S-adenosylmethionine ribosyltransferase-isomerase QueA [Verrucomicrobiae bacterium]|nr:tRNA preQ1(34) S-adenosylmethionine ribosyltransferase-isomerase QueA [Verrucomicrobiae bacterium]